jgi:hypothetical protein
MNLPARLNTAAAQLDQPSGAPAAHQLQLALQQTAASAGALSQPAQAQAMVAQQRAMDEAGAAVNTREKLASDLVMAHKVRLMEMTGFAPAHQSLLSMVQQAGVDSPQGLLDRIGMG